MVTGDQSLALGTSLMAATATAHVVPADVDEVQEEVIRFTNPL